VPQFLDFFGPLLQSGPNIWKNDVIWRNDDVIVLNLAFKTFSDQYEKQIYMQKLSSNYDVVENEMNKWRIFGSKINFTNDVTCNDVINSRPKSLKNWCDSLPTWKIWTLCHIWFRNYRLQTLSNSFLALNTFYYSIKKDQNN